MPDDRDGATAEPDEVLVARLAQSDRVAFALLYDRYARMVYSMGGRMVGASRADDLTQEVFLLLWQRAAQFDPERGVFRAWLLTIARHRMLEELRKQGRRRQVAVSEAIEAVLIGADDPAPDVEDRVWRSARGDRVRGALQTLPPEQRRVLLLAYFGGLSQSAIADRLGLPLGTVKKRVRLGLQKLRAQLGESMLESDLLVPTEIARVQRLRAEAREARR